MSPPSSLRSRDRRRPQEVALVDEIGRSTGPGASSRCARRWRRRARARRRRDRRGARDPARCLGRCAAPDHRRRVDDAGLPGRVRNERGLERAEALEQRDAVGVRDLDGGAEHAGRGDGARRRPRRRARRPRRPPPARRGPRPSVRTNGALIARVESPTSGVNGPPPPTGRLSAPPPWSAPVPHAARATNDDHRAAHQNLVLRPRPALTSRRPTRSRRRGRGDRAGGGCGREPGGRDECVNRQWLREDRPQPEQVEPEPEREGVLVAVGEAGGADLLGGRRQLVA